MGNAIAFSLTVFYEFLRGCISLLQIGWYNDHVLQAYKLPYDPETLAIIIISTPSMFEKSLKPFILRNDCLGVRDPVDECVSQQFQDVQQVC